MLRWWCQHPLWLCRIYRRWIRSPLIFAFLQTSASRFKKTKQKNNQRNSTLILAFLISHECSRQQLEKHEETHEEKRRSWVSIFFSSLFDSSNKAVQKPKKKCSILIWKKKPDDLNSPWPLPPSISIHHVCFKVANRPNITPNPTRMLCIIFISCLSNPARHPPCIFTKTV